MDLRKLKTLIDLVAESGVSELEVTEGEDKVRIVKILLQLQHLYNKFTPQHLLQRQQLRLQPLLQLPQQKLLLQQHQRVTP